MIREWTTLGSSPSRQACGSFQKLKASLAGAVRGPPSSEGALSPLYAQSCSCHVPVKRGAQHASRGQRQPAPDLRQDQRRSGEDLGADLAWGVRIKAVGQRRGLGAGLLLEPDQAGVADIGPAQVQATSAAPACRSIHAAAQQM